MKTCLLVTSSKAPARIAATHLHALFCDYGGQNVCCEVDEGMESTTLLQVGSGRYSCWVSGRFSIATREAKFLKQVGH